MKTPFRSLALYTAAALVVAVATQYPLPADENEVAASADAPTRTIRVPTPEAVPGLALKVGMTRDEVRALLGEPREARRMESGDGIAEVWTYVRDAGTQTNLVAATMRDVPYVDPITGVMRNIQEPEYTREILDLRTELSLLLFGGRLLSWKEKALPPKRSFN